jgi:hypothetical protein
VFGNGGVQENTGTDEFARLVDEIIAKDPKPTAYFTYNLQELPKRNRRSEHRNTKTKE